MSTFTIQSCSARMSLLGFARFRRMQTRGSLLPAGKSEARRGRKNALRARNRRLDMSGKLHEIKNNESTGMEARNRAIARLRNDTVFARFAMAAEIYENAGGEEARDRCRKPHRASSVSRIWLMCLFFPFFSIRLSPRSSFPPAHAHIYTLMFFRPSRCTEDRARARTLTRVPSIAALPPYPKRALSLSLGYIGRSRVGR